MGLFEEQLKARQENDKEMMQRWLGRLGAAVTGRASVGVQYRTAEDAIQEIFHWFQVTPPEPPSLMEDFDDRLDFMLNPTGIQRRRIQLTDMWWKDASGPMLAFTTENEAVALLPRRFGGYGWFDRQTGQYVKAGARTCKKLSGEAICFYRPFPLRPMTLKDLALFSWQSIDGWSVLLFVLTGLLASLLGTVTPLVTRLIFGTVIPSGNAANLAPVAILAMGMLLSVSLLGFTKSIAMARITQKLRLSVENAAMGRLLNLPAQFFQDYNAGALQNRMGALSQMCALLGDTVFTSGVSAVFSVVYLIQLRCITPVLTAPAVGILLVQLAVMIVGILLQARITRKRLGVATELNGLVFRLFSGIQKIKLAGAECRAFAKWAELYAKDAALLYHPPFLLKLQPALSGLITLGGSLLLYGAAAHAAVSVPDYMAFSSAYGLVSGAMLSLSTAAGSIANVKPLAELAEPILQAAPETGSGKKSLIRMSGSIELSQVSFRYTEDSPWILDHISLKIRPGQYIAIVGKTGCGKSTLMRLLLGFETPVSGAIYYDNRDLETLDLRAVRRNIGVVLQNSRLFVGDIYSNIVISAPWLTLADAWEAAKMAGVDDDIRKMPMGMQTLISEGGGGISGGQRQRIMIARAIAPKPKLLMFDEATSALDNRTQRVVSDSLNSLNCTRIVIAHRLSTIQQCDRILVLDEGKIVEDGKYDELLEAGGYFASLVQRQTLEFAAL